MTSHADDTGYVYDDAETNHSHAYLLPTTKAEVDAVGAAWPDSAMRLFDLGCGNGSVARHFAQRGWEVPGVDPSADGIAHARQHHPDLNLHSSSAYEDLAATYGTFPVVISLEVVEHVYDPRRYARTLHSLVQPGGSAIVSTPYHSYMKNLAMAVTGKLDAHFTALWDHGHIKFWSIPTLTTLLTEAGFKDIRFHRVGRVPTLAKSMIAVARRLP